MDSSKSIRMREAVPSDNRALVDLVHTAPIQAESTIWIDRDPDFFALLRLQGEDPRVWVAEDGERIVGNFSYSMRTEIHDGQPVKVLHCGDLRIHPDYRHSKAFLKIVKTYLKRLRLGDYHHAVVEIMEGNDDVLEMQRVLERVVTIVPAGDARLFQLVPFLVPRPDSAYRYRAAGQDDLDQLAEILQEAYGDYDGRPVLDRDGLLKLVSQHPSFPLGSIRVCEARKGPGAGRILACCGVWDQKDIRRAVVEKFTSSAASAIGIMRRLSFLGIFPPVPRAGEHLNYAWLRFPAWRSGHEDAGRQLVRSVLKDARRQGHYHFIWAGFHEKDSKVSCLDGLRKKESRVRQFHYYPKDRQAGAAAAGAVSWTDFSLV